VVDNLKSMKGFEDDLFATTVKEAAFTAYAGIYIKALSPLTAHFLFVPSGSSETASIM
jgi:hypothetical protein